MESNKLGYWLQVSANIGILAGLLLVGFQINENTEIARTELTARSYELSMEMGLALMGENPAAALVKAATDPSSLTDEELTIVEQWVWYWWDHDSHLDLLRDQGLVVQERDWDLFFKNRAKWVYGANQVSVEVWEGLTSDGIDSDWENLVDAEIQKIDQPTGLQVLERLRAAAKGD